MMNVLGYSNQIFKNTAYELKCKYRDIRISSASWMMRADSIFEIMIAFDPKCEYRTCEYELQQGCCFELNISLPEMTANDPKRTFALNHYLLK